MSENPKVEIQKQVPYPSRKAFRKFPFDEMQVGDSFLANVREKTTIYYHMKIHAPKRFITRTVKEDGLVGIRVWRVL